MQAIADEAAALEYIDEQQEPTVDLLSSRDEDIIF